MREKDISLIYSFADVSLDLRMTIYVLESIILLQHHIHTSVWSEESPERI